MTYFNIWKFLLSRRSSQSNNSINEHLSSTVFIKISKYFAEMHIFFLGIYLTELMNVSLNMYFKISYMYFGTESNCLTAHKSDSQLKIRQHRQHNFFFIVKSNWTNITESTPIWRIKITKILKNMQFDFICIAAIFCTT